MNDNDETASGLLARVADEAGLWAARMQGENADAYRTEFDRWAEQSPAHAQAYNKAMDAHREALRIAALPGYGPDRDRASELERARRAFHKQPWWATRGAMAASLVLGASLGTGLYLRQQSLDHSREKTASALLLMTRLGEIRTFHLADGSSLTLDTQSQVEVVINHQERRLRLRSGRARLEVAQGEQPFQIVSDAGRVSASKGIFDMAMSANREILLRPIFGSLDVRPDSGETATMPPIQTVATGQTFNFTLGRVDHAPVSRPQFSAADWPAGWLDCRNIDLSSLIEIAGHYSARPIMIDAPKSRKIEVTGRFKISDTTNFLRNIADQYDLTIVDDAHEIRLRGK